MELDVGRLLFAPMFPFVGHPERLAAIAVTCLVLAAVAFLVTRRGSWPLAGLGIVWAALAAWEQYCTVNGYNIRIDLLIIAPTILPLAIGTLYTAWQAFQSELQKQFSLRALLVSTTLVAVALGVSAWLTS
jgi:hypothetical protein